MPQKQRDRRELAFFEHLEELRVRIIRSVLYIAAGASVGWAYREPLLAIMRHPAEAGAKAVGIAHLPFRVFEPIGGFMIAIQVAGLAGVVLALPLLVWEVWGFIEPALEEHERKHVRWVLPSALILFASGVTFCYYVAPAAFAYLFTIDKSLGVDVERTLQPYLVFMVRFMLGFGLGFELPLVVVFLNVIGLVSSTWLLRYWRQAVVVVFVFAAIVTPTWDPVNMTIMALPLVVLYAVSVLLVWLLRHKEEEAREAAARQAAAEEGASIAQGDLAVTQEAEDGEHGGAEGVVEGDTAGDQRDPED
jgi:sec-independent protein translocase protein TatC